MRNNVARLKKVAAEYGGHIEDDSAGDECVYQCCAPKGKVWSCDFLHMLKVQWYRRSSSERETEVADAVQRMQHGVEACNVADCDYCNPEEEENVSD